MGHVPVLVRRTCRLRSTRKLEFFPCSVLGLVRQWMDVLRAVRCLTTASLLLDVRWKICGRICGLDAAGSTDSRSASDSGPLRTIHHKLPWRCVSSELMQAGSCRGAVHRYRAGTPAIRAGVVWRRRPGLVPRCLASPKCCHWRARVNMFVKYHVRTTMPVI